MNKRLHLLIILFSLYFICALCVANNPRIQSSAQGRAYSSIQQHHGRTYISNQYHQNYIKSYNRTHNVTQPQHVNQKKSSKSSSSAESKFLSVFTLVNIANEQCTVDSTMGFCVSAKECTDFGGTNLGTCANGYGTCCYKAIMCGETSSMNVTYIQNANYPSYTTNSGSCSHTITRQSNVCNLRLDFVAFELSDPTLSSNSASNGKCENDQMTVSGITHSQQLTYLCGKMPPIWHFYLDVRDASNPTTFNFALSSAVTKSRLWNIKVTQIDCDRRIPQGCGQYFTGTSGDPLYSFNWGNTGMYLYGMNYAICFRQEKGYCTHSFVDSGPSWVACTDSLAFPSADVGENNVLGTNGVDLRDCMFSGLATAWPSPITTNNYSPTYIYHWTNQDNPFRYLSSQPAANTPGFYFTWTHNAC